MRKISLRVADTIPVVAALVLTGCVEPMQPSNSADLSIGATITMVSGNNQIAVRGDPLREPLVAIVRTSDGRTASKATVEWTSQPVPFKGGVFKSETDTRGEVRMNVPATPLQAGQHSITARVPATGNAIVFRYTTF